MRIAELIIREPIGMPGWQREMHFFAPGVAPEGVPPTAIELDPSGAWVHLRRQQYVGELERYRFVSVPFHLVRGVRWLPEEPTIDKAARLAREAAKIEEIKARRDVANRPKGAASKSENER